MITFLCTFIVLWSLRIVASLIMLAFGWEEEPSSPGAKAAGVLLKMGFIIWALYLLNKLAA